MDAKRQGWTIHLDKAEDMVGTLILPGQKVDSPVLRDLYSIELMFIMKYKTTTLAQSVLTDSCIDVAGSFHFTRFLFGVEQKEKKKNNGLSSSEFLIVLGPF